MEETSSRNSTNNEKGKNHNDYSQNRIHALMRRVLSADLKLDSKIKSLHKQIESDLEISSSLSELKQSKSFRIGPSLHFSLL